ncbi:DNA primase family protein [Streptomyces massasporeus]|uniref:DNA primase family protein n=1 Tax=Streptomyces massasporeus TaxID=67324 RepID=UPI003649169D
MTDAITWIMGFTPKAADKLAGCGIPLDRAEDLGIHGVTDPDQVPAEISRFWVRGPGMVIDYRQPGGTVVPVWRPDVPVPDPDHPEARDKDHKYVAPAGSGGSLNHRRAAAPGKPVLLVEGSLQTACADVWAPADWGVVGMNGCWGWSGADLTWSEGHEVIVFPDADVSTNRRVWEAVDGLRGALEAEGAARVAVARLPATGSDGLDDVVGRRPEDRRTSFLERVANLAATRMPRRPPVGSEFFESDRSLKVATLAASILAEHPAALTAEDGIALYADGVYRINGAALVGAMARRLGEAHRSTYLESLEQVVRARLYAEGRTLPAHAAEPVVNLANGMVDLRTGEFRPHSPEFMSCVQLPVMWDPSAQCPAYAAWLAEVCPEQAAELEDAVCAMLDPSRTPSKAVFLFGPSRSGKSTFLRIMSAIAGPENTSGVTLHQLSDSRFAAARVYGKILNAAADLSSRDVEDLSVFKMLTGEDRITADRKFGHLFEFTNRALFAFSANDLPQVSEASRAYAERIKPIRFGHSFAGHEDPAVEDKIMAELPGILARWVRAWQAKNVRGGYLPTADAVREEFETRSDRVRQWIAEELEITESGGSTPAELHRRFNRWAETQGVGSFGRNKLMDRLKNCPGVREVRVGTARARGLNLTFKSEENPLCPD